MADFLGDAAKQNGVVQQISDDRSPMMPNAQAQEHSYSEGADYVAGSPHLKHPALRARLVDRNRVLVEAARQPTRNPRVLEIGGGHGTLTEHLASFGADVTVSEISKPSAQVLTERFSNHQGVQVLHDADGETVFGLPGDFDVIVCISVLHHIPDYLGYVRRLVPLLRPGGTFAAFQDPDWYPRRRRTDAVADKGCYYAWRLAQGNLREGARTRMRRLRGHYDESLAADMTEYHVVRQGLDDKALVEQLNADFATVEMTRYWSTQAAALQRFGEKMRWLNTFGVVATGHLGRND